jgi:hypothetical protein
VGAIVRVGVAVGVRGFAVGVAVGIVAVGGIAVGLRVFSGVGVAKTGSGRGVLVGSAVGNGSSNRLPLHAPRSKFRMINIVTAIILFFIIFNRREC